MKATYDLALPASTLALARRDGFSLLADVVPSALGVPVSTGMTPAEYDAYVQRLIEIAGSDPLFVDGSSLEPAS